MSTQVTVTENGIQVEVTGTLPVTANQLDALNAADAPSATNPLLTRSDGDARYQAAPIADSDVPSTIARDSEVTAAIGAHAAAVDPHGDRGYADGLASNYDAAGAASAAVSNHVAATDPHGDRAYSDAAILAGAPGGSTVSNQVLKAWTESKAYEMLAITYDGTFPSLIVSATVQWPDGSAGILTITASDTTKLVETAYTITHVASGKTVTQAAVTLNANGFVTVKPALTVA